MVAYSNINHSRNSTHIRNLVSEDYQVNSNKAGLIVFTGRYKWNNKIPLAKSNTEEIQGAHFFLVTVKVGHGK